MIIKVTANYPTNEIKSIVKFAAKFCEIDHKTLVVKVKNSSRTFRGAAYNGVMCDADYKVGRRLLVTLGIGKCFPLHFKAFHFETWQECLVYLAGHEFGHVYGYQNPKVTNTESMATWYGNRCLEAWKNRD